MWAPAGSGDRIADAAHRNGASTVLGIAGDGDADDVDLRIVQAPNRSLESVIGALSDLEGVHISFFPQGVVTLAPPTSEPPERVQDVTLRSPIEIFLAGLQSVGSWRGFLSYAAVGGVVAWTGLLTNTVYLLVGAMLIAPFAGPAMNAAMASARGDATLLGRSVGRYVAAIATTVAVTAICTAAYGLRAPTQLMGDVSSVALTAVLLPLAAGAAGAINLAQSERSSLVSGAATGMLVAAALAPPAGVTGMALAMGEWDMAARTLFLLVLQLVGINTAGALVFRLVGLGPEGARFPKGSHPVQRAATAVSLLLVAALIAIQLLASPVLQRATIAQRAEGILTAVIAAQQGALLDADVRFPAYGQASVDTLFVTAYVAAAEDRTAEITAAVTEALRRDLEVTPVVWLTTVSP